MLNNHKAKRRRRTTKTHQNAVVTVMGLVRIWKESLRPEDILGMG
jgi:hypothetical protein